MTPALGLVGARGRLLIAAVASIAVVAMVWASPRVVVEVTGPFAPGSWEPPCASAFKAALQMEPWNIQDSATLIVEAGRVKLTAPRLSAEVRHRPGVIRKPLPDHALEMMRAWGIAMRECEGAISRDSQRRPQYFADMPREVDE